MNIHLLNGFLGSGKTTAIREACVQLMQNGVKVGVITNDQGIKLVDGDFFRSLSIPNRQVINGCFCCNYDQFESNMASLIDTDQPDVIFAESVGSCTDIVATVIKPLQKFHPDVQLTFSVFADARLLLMMLQNNSSLFDKSVRYIYHKQLEEASIIIINKIDLLSIEDAARLRELIKQQFNGRRLRYQNSTAPGCVREYLELLNDSPYQNQNSLVLDYEIYGTGEAKLAWVDQEVTIYSAEKNANREAKELIKNIYEKIIAFGFPIGHLKFLVNDETKISFTAISDTSTISLDNRPADTARVLMNARVQTEPDELSRIVAEAIETTERWSGCKITVDSLAAFQPGFPKPSHRM